MAEFSGARVEAFGVEANCRLREIVEVLCRSLQSLDLTEALDPASRISTFFTVLDSRMRDLEEAFAFLEVAYFSLGELQPISLNNCKGCPFKQSSNDPSNASLVALRSFVVAKLWSKVPLVNGL